MQFLLSFRLLHFFFLLLCYCLCESNKLSHPILHQTDELRADGVFLVCMLRGLAQHPDRPAVGHIPPRSGPSPARPGVESRLDHNSCGAQLTVFGSRFQGNQVSGGKVAHLVVFVKVEQPSSKLFALEKSSSFVYI